MARKKRIIMINKKLKKLLIYCQIETQSLRLKIIRELEELFTYAKQMLKATQDEAWARVAAYTAQVINSLANSFDEVRLNEQMKELERLIEIAKKRVGTSKTGTPVT